jgi:hypothetical protein
MALKSKKNETKKDPKDTEKKGKKPKPEKKKSPKKEPKTKKSGKLKKEPEAKEPIEEDFEMPEGEPDLSSLLPPTDVMELSQLFMSLLGNSAWQHIGLIPDPKTGKIEVDLKQAGLAIDIMSFIYEKTKGDIDKDMAAGIRDLLTNLRVNYVNKLKSST